MKNKNSAFKIEYSEPGSNSCSGHSVLIINKFRFIKPKSGQTVTKYITYRPPKLLKGKRWWIQYYFRVPDELVFEHGEWKKFRVFENINRYKSDEYAQLLLAAVEQELANGYDPFKYERKDITNRYTPQTISLNTAIDKFLSHCQQKGLRKKTIQSYTCVVKILKTYFLNDSNRLYDTPDKILKVDIKNFLIQAKGWQGWNNHTYNNNLSAIKTVFNYMVKEEIILKNPAEFIDDLPTVSTKNTYYDEKKGAAIKKLMAGTYIHKFCEFIYYTGTRPKSEARLLRIENILFDRKLIFIPGEVSKNRSGDYIPMCDELIILLESMNLDKYPTHYYIWGTHGKPAQEPAGQNHFANLYKPYKDKLKLGANYSVYSWKHTRAIELATAGANPYEIMKLFRHSSLEMTQKYLRDLGCSISQEINNKTKAF